MILGRICYAWAMLDREVNTLIGALMQLDDPEVACLATELDNVAARTRLLQKSARCSSMPDWWQSSLDNVLKRIANDLAPLRNRCIHDSWRFRDGQHVRIDRRAFIKKVQARTTETLLYDLEHSMTREELETLIGDVMIAMFGLRGAGRDLESHRETLELAQAKSLLCLVADAWADQLQERQK